MQSRDVIVLKKLFHSKRQTVLQRVRLKMRTPDDTFISCVTADQDLICVTSDQDPNREL